MIQQELERERREVQARKWLEASDQEVTWTQFEEERRRREEMERLEELGIPTPEEQEESEHEGRVEAERIRREIPAFRPRNKNRRSQGSTQERGEERREEVEATWSGGNEYKKFRKRANKLAEALREEDVNTASERLEEVLANMTAKPM
jgi:multidrug efflux pump subunit AcrB